MQLSIIMPVYNEDKVIAKTIRNVESQVNILHELLIIYDMNEDTTVTVVKKLQDKYSQIKLVKTFMEKGH